LNRLAPNIWHVPMLMILLMGGTLVFRANSLLVSFEEMIIRRKSHDLQIVTKAIELSKSDNVPSAIASLAHGAHSNTLVFAGEEYSSPSVIIQPLNPISQPAITSAKTILKDLGNQNDLLDNGIKFHQDGRTYHLILGETNIAGGNWYFAFLTNVSGSIQSQYHQSLTELTIAFAVLAIITVGSTAGIAQSISRITSALPDRKTISPRWWWVGQTKTLSEVLNKGWQREDEYIVELNRAKNEAETLAESEKALRLEFELLQQTWRHDLLSAVLGVDNMFKRLDRIGFNVEDPLFKEPYDLAKAKASFAYRLVRDTRDLGVAIKNLEKNPITLTQLLESIKILYTESDITYSLSDGDRSILINEASFVGRAISNLINNAVKFSGLNGIIEVGIRTKDENAIIYVRDNGIGISEEGCKKIFSGVGSGVRMAPDIPGDGFGLYSAKGIVEAHGGSISVKSVLGQGTVFFIKIPLL